MIQNNFENNWFLLENKIQNKFEFIWNISKSKIQNLFEKYDSKFIWTKMVPAA